MSNNDFRQTSAAAMSEIDANAEQAKLNVVQLARDCARASRLASQRGARMQIMREAMLELPIIWQQFIEARPDAAKWFDEDGVPVSD